MHIADGWLLLVSLMADDVLFKLELRSVAVGWQLWIALVDGVVLFGMGLMVLSLLGSVVLFKLDCRLVAVCCWVWESLVMEGIWFVGVRWHAWVSLVVDDGLLMLERMASLMVGVKLFEMDLIAGAVGWLSLLGLVVMRGMLFTSVGIVGVVGWRGRVAFLLVDDGLFKVGLVTVAVGWRLW